MAINSNGILEDKTTSRSRCSSKTSNLSSCRLIKINFAGKDRCCTSKAYNKDIKSPYFTNDKAQMLNRVAEKKLITNKPVEIFSSFPLAASVYKANSDEFKSKKNSPKKVKKSVLTLPNEPAPMPKAYTVSDLNDSEGFNVANGNGANKPKKRRCIKRFKKARVKEHAMEFYDRDARYCSQLNIDLDCSSSEVVNFTGDGKKVSGPKRKSKNSTNPGDDPHDVWNVLRNINKFQFIPSSQGSVVSLRKRRPLIRKNNNRNDTHFIETCHTEEISYISSYEVDSKTHGTCSPSSSFDRVTVIDKQSEQSEIIQLSQNIIGSNLKFKDKIKSNRNNQMRGRNKLSLKNCSKKKLNVKKKKESNPVLAIKLHEETPQLEGENVLNGIKLPEAEKDFESSDVLKPIYFGPCSDSSSIKEKDRVSNDLTNNLLYADRSLDENKMNITKSLTKSRNIKVNGMKPMGDSEKQLSGITKVILSKGQEILSTKLTESQRKPCPIVPLSNANLPKLSQLEIKRRIANQKFPIVILGKDQITNQGIYVPKDEPTQFYGLDNHVWPFMLEWSEERRSDSVQGSVKKETIKSKNQKGKQKLSHRDDVITKVNHKEICSNDHTVLKQPDELKKVKISTISTNNYSTRLVNEDLAKVSQKPKPLFLLKNKMFQFLHKKPINYSQNDWRNKHVVESIQKHIQVDTKNITKKSDISNSIPISVKTKDVTDKPVENRIVNKSYSSLRHPWAKGKWASNFIENIIKKIRTGVYYGVERNENKYRINGSEVSTQTEMHSSKNAYCQNGVDGYLKSKNTFKKDDTLKNIPGFDTTFTTLEIETITTNTIAVKHCISNVVVQFDIQVMNDTKNITHPEKSMSCIPINLNQEYNQEKIFKCNTSIINAFLPAELCTIIPNMMQTLFDTETNLISQPMTTDNCQTHMTPQASGFSEPETSHITINSVINGGAMYDKITPILKGRFMNAYAKKNISTNLLLPTNDKDSCDILGPTINMQILCQFNQPSVILHLSNNNVNTSNIQMDKPEQIPKNITNTCVALQLYDPRKHSIVPFLGCFSIADFINKIVHRENLLASNKSKYIIKNNLMLNGNIMITRPLLLPRSEDQNNLSLLPRGKIGIISLFNAFNKNIQFVSKQNKDIISLNTFETNSEKKEKPYVASVDSNTVQRRKPQSIKVPRKKSYVRCYRKCNSMSSIASFKSTPLNKVTNLNEFCQVLGSNVFCSVLDGCLEKKILGAVEEMKNWITDLSPKQALLILLLTNKKDTPNLIRFRPVLFQGIAVNRITKAVELDTEIEVIERENFHKVSQCEGISYLPACTKNYDSLLEELYWIAKTTVNSFFYSINSIFTASDYQKTFDESSEKLLKSLLEKRKKLNPSYLRVMARYVGLGLLAPKKL